MKSTCQPFLNKKMSIESNRKVESGQPTKEVSELRLSLPPLLPFLVLPKLTGNQVHKAGLELRWIQYVWREFQTASKSRIVLLAEYFG